MDDRFKDAPFGDPCEICKYRMNCADDYPCVHCCHNSEDLWEPKDD